jgi:hypothetical protein
MDFFPLVHKGSDETARFRETVFTGELRAVISTRYLPWDERDRDRLPPLPFSPRAC